MNVIISVGLRNLVPFDPRVNPEGVKGYSRTMDLPFLPQASDSLELVVGGIILEMIVERRSYNERRDMVIVEMEDLDDAMDVDVEFESDPNWGPPVCMSQAQKSPRELSELSTSLGTRLGLSTRASNALLNAGINSIEQLVEKREGELLRITNFGKGSLKEVKDALAKLKRQGRKS